MMRRNPPLTFSVFLVENSIIDFVDSLPKIVPQTLLSGLVVPEGKGRQSMVDKEKTAPIYIRYPVLKAAANTKILILNTSS